MDKNKFFLGGRLFNMASPRLGAPTQRKARPQDGRPNATQGTSVSWAPQRNTRHIGKLRAPTHVCNANARHIRNARHVSTSANWAPQRNARNVHKMDAQTQCKAHLQVGRPNATQGTFASWAPQCTSATQTQGTSTSWVPQRNARHVRKMGAQTQNSSAMKKSTQGSTRLKDELEDG
jgi:hypothetical protein